MHLNRLILATILLCGTTAWAGPNETSTLVNLDFPIETNHPYDLNTGWTLVGTIEAPTTALSVTVHIDQGYVESGYDKLAVTDAHDGNAQYLTGELSGKTATVPGNTANLWLYSDRYIDGWGFLVNQYSYTQAYECNGDTPGLCPVRSCGDLRDYVAQMVTESLLQRPIRWYFDRPMLAANKMSESAGPTDFTTTNVQEKGVDEPDITETDGNYLYVLHNDSLIIVDSFPAEETREVARLDLGGSGVGMFLDGSRITVLSQSYEIEGFENGSTRISIVDIENRARPRILAQFDVEGWYVNARAIEGQVYFITNSRHWNVYDEAIRSLCKENNEKAELECWAWDKHETEEAQQAARAAVQARLLPLVRAHYESVPKEDLLPKYNDRGRLGSAMECTDLQRPWKTVNAGLVMFSSIDTRAVGSFQVSTSGIIGEGYEVYASKNNIYLSHSSRFWPFWNLWNQKRDLETVIHKLSLPRDGGAPVYEATGKIMGWTTDQFSMSEKDGLLRVATSEEWWGRNGDGNSVWVLEQDDRSLRVKGSLRGLSPNQRTFAVRFIGDMGYVVTAENIDPLHVIDFSKPNAPIQLGELEIPGFSSYLHPFADGILLAIGRDGDNALQLSMFDVTDGANPLRIHQTVVEAQGWSEAMDNHLAFTYHPERQMLAIPLSTYGSDYHFSGSVIFKVSQENGFEEVGRVDHSDIGRAAQCEQWFTEDNRNCFDQTFWVSMRRNTFIEDKIYSVSNAGLSVNNLYNPRDHYASMAWQLGPWHYYNNQNIDIPDNDYRGVNLTTEVEGKPDCDAYRVFVDFNINHTYRGDIKMQLTDPNGQTIVIQRNNSQDSEANLYVYNRAVEGLANDGINGTWTLNIADMYGKDTGTLNYWSLRLSCTGYSL